MKCLLNLAVLTVAALDPGSALALDCRRAVSAVDIAICHHSKLLQLDRDVDEAYRRSRNSSVGSARLALLNQQRSWLQNRDNLCRTAAANCLASSYMARLEQLRVSQSAAKVGEARSDRAVPAALNGTWRIVSVRMGVAKTTVDAASLRQALNGADLPPVGSTVQANRERLCSSDQPCEHMTWSATTLEQVDGGPQIAQDLNLPVAHRAYSGSTGSSQSNIILVPDQSRNLLAYFILCSSSHSNCKVAFEVWEPANMGAYVLPK